MLDLINDFFQSQEHGRYVVNVPLSRPHLANDYISLLLRVTCRTACVGGPNRRQFLLMFSLLRYAIIISELIKYSVYMLNLFPCIC